MRADRTLADLQRDAYAIAEEKGWHSVPRSFGDLIALTHSELSEALEEYRTGQRDPFQRSTDGDGKPAGVPSELADVVIRLLDLCGVYGIDLAAAVEEKMAYNRTRAFRHGRKRL